jgi:hypothetical protein
MRATVPTRSIPFPRWSASCKRSGIACEVLFLHASDEVLLKRYAETRRKHPLVSAEVSLREAIASERKLLEPITIAADLVIDTSNMGVHTLRERIRERIAREGEARLALMFESFGYKHGIPGDADFVFDVRSLPNPYWDHSLRHLTGRDAQVIDYLAGHASVRTMIDSIAEFLDLAHRRVRAGEPQLSDHRHRLHRRPAPLGVHRRGAGRAFRRSYPQCSPGTTRCRKPDLPSARKARISSARARASASPRAISSRV